MWNLSLYAAFSVVLLSSSSVAELRGSSSLPLSSSSSLLWSPLREGKHEAKENEEMMDRQVTSTIGNKDDAYNMVRQQMPPPMLLDAEDEQELAGRGHVNDDEEFASIPNGGGDHHPPFNHYLLHDNSNNNVTGSSDEGGIELKDVQRQQRRRRHLQFYMSTLEKKNGRYVNQKRVAYKLHPLPWSQDLIKQAQAHAVSMAHNNKLVHRDPLNAGIQDSDWLTIAENVCQGRNATKEGCFTDLLNSPGHFSAIVNAEYTHMGVGVSCNSYWCFVCQIFKKAPAKSIKA